MNVNQYRHYRRDLMVILKKRNSFQEINNSGIKIQFGQNFNQMRLSSKFRQVKTFKADVKC